MKNFKELKIDIDKLKTKAQKKRFPAIWGAEEIIRYQHATDLGLRNLRIKLTKEAKEKENGTV